MSTPCEPDVLPSGASSESTISRCPSIPPALQPSSQAPCSIDCTNSSPSQTPSPQTSPPTLVLTKSSRKRPRSPTATDQLENAIENSRLRKIQKNKRYDTARRNRRLAFQGRIENFAYVRLDNELSKHAYEVLRGKGIEEVVAERYITALHALDTVRSIAGKHFDEVSGALVINAGELRRVFALHLFARRAERKNGACSLPFRKILAGHVNQPSLSAAPFQTRSDLVSRFINRFAKAPPMKGATIREARDALAAAAWRGTARRENVARILAGTEIVGKMKEEARYIDVEFESDEDEEDEGKGRIDRKDEYLNAVKELPDTENVPRDVLLEIARKVEDFAGLLKKAPLTQRVDDAFEIVRKSGRFERETGHSSLSRCRVGGMWEMNGPGKSGYGIWNMPEGPSRLPYRMALYRTEALKWMVNLGVDSHITREKAEFARVLREEVFQRAAVRIHPFVERLFYSLFSSVDDVAEDLSMLRHFGELLGEKIRVKVWRAAVDVQVKTLQEQMITKEAAVARKLILHFRSVRRVVRASLDELELVYRDQGEAHRISQVLHGYCRDYFVPLMGHVKLPYLVGRVLHDEVGDACLYREASFSCVVGKSKRMQDVDEKRTEKGGFVLTEDERIAAYQALHVNRDIHNVTSWERFEASWGLFCLVCRFATVSDPVGVTCGLLDEKRTGARVLERLAKQSIEKTCMLVPGLCADDAIRAKTFASNFFTSWNGIISRVIARDEGRPM